MEDLFPRDSGALTLWQLLSEGSSQLHSDLPLGFIPRFCDLFNAQPGVPLIHSFIHFLSPHNEAIR